MLRVRVEFNGIQGTPYLATHYFDGGTPAEATSAVAAVGTFWNAVDGIISDMVTWNTDTAVAQVNPVDGSILDMYSVTSITASGAATTELLPLASQAVIQWRTGVYLSGREVRGRTFIPGLTQGTNDDGKVLASIVTSLESNADAFVAASTLGVWSRSNGQFVVVQDATVWDQFAMLTSRRD